MIFYIFDENSIYTRTQEHIKGNAIPSNSTTIAVGEFPDGKFARFNGVGWDILDEYPTKAPQVPQTLTPLQAKLQLLEIGLLDEVETMAANDRKVQLYWEYASVIERNHPTLLAMATALGLTDEQLDEMFIAASKLS